MNIVAVIVTYGDRFAMCKQVIDACLEQGANAVVVVDNASSPSSSAALASSARQDPRIQVVKLVANTGSAGGFRAGLEYVLARDQASYAWLLDDDNVPQGNALDVLRKTGISLETGGFGPCVLYSYRGDSRPRDKLAVFAGYVKGYDKNSFNGFSVQAAVREKLLVKFTRRPEPTYFLARVHCGPYGGMFLPLVVLKESELPNPDFFVYADDHDFSLKLDKRGILQFLVYGSTIRDIDVSPLQGSRLFSRYFSDMKVFYSIRNHTYLSFIHVENKWCYRINKLVYLCWIYMLALRYFALSPRLVRHRLHIIQNAFADGEAGRLGKTFHPPEFPVDHA